MSLKAQKLAKLRFKKRMKSQIFGQILGVFFVGFTWGHLPTGGHPILDHAGHHGSMSRDSPPSLEDERRGSRGKKKKLT